MSLPFDPASIRLVAFDFDGVILESADLKTQAFAELFAEHGEAVARQFVAYHLAHQGISRFKKFEWFYRELLRRPLSETESQRLGKRFSELVYQKILIAPIVAGCQELLEVLHLHGLAMAVISGTPQDELLQIVEHRGLQHFFSHVIGAPTEKPEAIRRVLEDHGLGASQALFIGDGLSDFKAAQATQLAFVARRTVEAPMLWDNVPVPCLVDDLHPLLAWSWQPQTLSHSSHKSS